MSRVQGVGWSGSRRVGTLQLTADIDREPGVIGNLVIVKRHLNMATQYRYLDVFGWYLSLPILYQLYSVGDGIETLVIKEVKDVILLGAPWYTSYWALLGGN